MLRTTAIAVAITTAIVAAALAPNVAIARGGVLHSVGHGPGGFHSVAHVGGVGRFHHVAHFRRGFRGFGVYAYYGDDGCWRWLPTRRGYVRVWVC